MIDDFANPIAVGLTVGGVHRLVELWDLYDSAGASVGRFAVNDRDIEYGGATYSAADAPSASVSEHLGELVGGEVDVAGAFSAQVSLADLRARLVHGGTATRTVVDARFPDVGAFGVEQFRVATVGFDEDMAKVVFAKLETVFGGPVGNRLTRKCRWKYGVNNGTVGCFGAASLSTVTVTSVSAGEGYYKFTGTATAGSLASGIDGGEVIWTVGNNAGVRGEVQISSGTSSPVTVTLQESVPFVIEVGDECTIGIGCDKTSARCIALLGSVANAAASFGGFGDIPGRRALLDTPDVEQV